MNIKAFVSGTIAGAALAVAALSFGTMTWAGMDRDLTQEEENLAIAIQFYDLLLNKKDFEAGRKMMGDRYVQHNPNAKDGYEGIEAHINMIKEKYPQNYGEIKRAFTYGDLVALHVHSKRTPDSLGNAVVDMFRIENGKVVEHWDVVQAVPEEALNDNTMF